MAVENNSMGAIGNEMQMAQKKGIQTLPDGKATSRLKQLICIKDFGNYVFQRREQNQKLFYHVV